MKKNLASRQYLLIGIFLTVGIIFVCRLFYLQVIETKYIQLSNNNALRYKTQYPARGRIYDRNGKLLVDNEAVYDLMVVPREVRKLDTNLFCARLGITREEFIERMMKARKYSSYAPSIFEKQISKEDFAAIQEKLYSFKGFYEQRRTLRKYPRSVAAHAMGYIGEVNNRILEENPYYKVGDYIGMSGLEKTYEEVLRGKKGIKIKIVDVHNREQGSFQEGIYDTLEVSGADLYCTIDIEVQAYAEQLMKNKRGSIIAIEPATGEILAFVSAPNYDPNLLVGRKRSKNYIVLEKDLQKPLFNRVLQAKYPPGSIFKVAQAMVALDMGVITTNSGFVCDKGLVGCHNHPSARTVAEGIKMSCNPYFYRVFQRIVQQRNDTSGKIDSKYGLDLWEQYMHKLGFGIKLPIDLPNVLSGHIPNATFYDKWYPSGWNFFTIYSNSIGQGEVEVIPLQMANLAAIAANRGWYITPHLVRSWGDSVRWRKTEYRTKHLTPISSHYWEIAAEGMYGVVHEAGGTARRARIDDIAVCGKTGTAQNIGADHSVFIAFAPQYNPKIAIAVYVENAKGGGGTWAAPIASLVIEKYLRGEVLRKEMEKTYMEAAPCQPLPLVRTVKKKPEKK